MKQKYVSLILGQDAEGLRESRSHPTRHRLVIAVGRRTGLCDSACFEGEKMLLLTPMRTKQVGCDAE